MPAGKRQMAMAIKVMIDLSSLFVHRLALFVYQLDYTSSSSAGLRASVDTIPVAKRQANRATQSAARLYLRCTNPVVFGLVKIQLTCR